MARCVVWPGDLVVGAENPSLPVEPQGPIPGRPKILKCIMQLVNANYSSLLSPDEMDHNFRQIDIAQVFAASSITSPYDTATAERGMADALMCILPEV